MEWYYYVIIIGGSAFAGALNTLAGNGSAITLTILTELLQLHGNLANGTNRVGIFMQSLAGSIAFYRNGKLRLDRGGIYIVCTLIGAIIGIIAANLVSSEQFKSVFRFLMVLMLLVLLVKPKRWLQATDNQYQMKIWLTIPAFLALGFYGGFIQMGMGVFFLAAMVLGARFSIMESNAIKIFVVGLYTLLAIAIFQWNGLIDWKVGLLMAIGQTTGGWFTAHYASKYPGADIWAYRLLIVVVILAIVKMFNLHSYLI